MEKIRLKLNNFFRTNKKGRKLNLSLKGGGGFTLLETIIAVGIIVVGLTAALSLFATSISAVTVVRERITAANLVQEGIEITRNIRDNNWLQNLTWNTGLSNGDYQGQYNSTGLLGYTGTPVLFDSLSGLFNYTTGNPTPYVRKITLTNVSPPPPPATSTIELKVVVDVSWVNRGRSLSVSAEDHLFNWK